MSNDRRRSKRFSALSERRAGELRQGTWRRLRVSIDNESAGGFAVTLSGKSREPAQGEEFQLVTGSGSTWVRVVYVTRLTSGLHLGLQRVDETERGRSRRESFSQAGLVACLALVCGLAIRLLLGNLGWL